MVKDSGHSKLSCEPSLNTEIRVLNYIPLPDCIFAETRIVIVNCIPLAHKGAPPSPAAAGSQALSGYLYKIIWKIEMTARLTSGP